MDIGRLVKWLLVVAVVYFAWKYGLPMIQQLGGGTHASGTSQQSSCPGAASNASEAWGNGLHQFVNPPYDVAAWSDFRARVDSKISAAESECSCSSESCEKVRSAMSDLRGLVSDLDTAIRNGSAPPSDVAQRQEAIDRKIDDAAELTRSGK